MAKHEGFVDVVAGLAFGDEGKGRVIDGMLETGEYGIVARYNGANNAGHSLVLKNGMVLVLNAMPSGVLYPHVTCYIGSGCVVDPVNLYENEIPKVQRAQIDLKGRFKISTAATAITPIHILLDGVNGGHIGTTGKGVGPAYVSRAARATGSINENLRFAEILENHALAREVMESQYERLVKHNLIKPVPDIGRMIAKFLVAVKSLDLQGFFERDSLWMTKQVKAGKNVLMEGAQAYGLDVTLSPVPFSTSSSTLADNAFVGGDISARYHRKVIGVSKLITSKVGAGPFVGEYGGNRSEIHCAEKNDNGKTKYTKDFEAKMFVAQELLKSEDPFLFGIGLRMVTGEYGATTGRPRRLGMLDLRFMAAAAQRSGIDELVLTKMDCLRYFEGRASVPVITGYRLNGEEIDYVPITAKEIEGVEPLVEEMAIPERLSREIARFDQLPSNSRALIGRIQHETGVRVGAIGIGPGREEMIKLAP